MKKGLIKSIFSIMTAGILVMSIAGCGKPAEGTAGKSEAMTLESIKSKGKLVIGTSADYPPYEFHKEVNGTDEIVGFDIKIANDIADDLGVELEIKDMDFDGLLVALQSNKVDMIFAGMTPTDERKENADFSDIYYTATHRFVLRSGEEKSIKSMEDLKGKKIGVQKGSIQEGIAQDNFDAQNIKSLSKVTDLVLDLKNNKVDAILLEQPVAEINCEKNDGIAITDFEVADPDGGTVIAMRKESDEVKDEVNKVIGKLQDENKINQYIKKANEMVD